MTRKTWFAFALVQFLGCSAYLVAMKLLYADPLHQSLVQTVLWRAYRWSICPGNVVGGLLLSTFHFYSVAAWRFGYLPLAVFLNAGFWWLCVVSLRAIREHVLGVKAHRYAITFVVATIVFVIVNTVDYYSRPAMCSDCFFPHGVPFNLWHEGGFAGGEAIMWGGLAADALIIASAATLMGGAWQWWFTRRSPYGANRIFNHDVNHRQ